MDRLTRVDLPTGPMQREDYVFDANDNRVPRTGSVVGVLRRMAKGNK